MFTSTRGCAEPMLPVCQLKVKVTIEGPISSNQILDIMSCRYLEGQGHSMTLQQNSVQPITLLFEVGFFKIFYKNDHHIEMTCHAQI